MTEKATELPVYIGTACDDHRTVLNILLMVSCKLLAHAHYELIRRNFLMIEGIGLLWPIYVKHNNYHVSNFLDRCIFVNFHTPLLKL